LGVSIGFLFRNSVELKIYCVLYAIHKSSVLSTFGWSHLIGHLVVAIDLCCFHRLVAVSYSVKVTREFPLTPSGYEMAVKTVA